MSLEAAVRIGARRNGADLRVVNVPALAGFAERVATAFHVLTGAPMESTRDLVRCVLMSEMHSSHFERPDEHKWFEWVWSLVKYPEAARVERRRVLRLLPGGATPRKRQRRLPKLRVLVSNGGTHAQD
jgi:hypothetical protein